ncbi:MAG TPA: class IV adenylate cyclase [Pyrinomonadaceae bacterium]|jgi:adenylate cyclase class 2
MAIEIEKKYRLRKEQREFVSEKLKEAGATFGGEDFEENILYRGSALDEKNAVLRVRKIGEKAVLTYKRRIQNQFDIKQQIEYETLVENVNELEKIIENLGFRKKLIYEKRRETWHFREVEIVLDELAFGIFMEIEGSVTAIVEAEMLLDIEDFEVEHKTYPHLTIEFGREKDGIIEARFA